MKLPNRNFPASIRFIIIAMLLSICQSLVGQELVENTDLENGLIYFIRGKGFQGSATGFSALIDGERVCKLNNRKYSFHKISPGTHEISVQFAGKKGKRKAEILELNIEAGGTYYIQMIMQTTFFTADLDPIGLTRNSALRIVKDDKIILDPNCGESQE